MIEGLKVIEERCTTCEYHRWYSFGRFDTQTLDICARDINFDLPPDGYDLDCEEISAVTAAAIEEWHETHRVGDTTVCFNWWGPKVVK